MIKLKSLISLREGLYLIIPIITISLWALVALIKDNFVIIDAVNFPAYYYAGKYIFTDPTKVYYNEYPSTYFYFPSFAVIFSLLSILDYSLSQWIFFFIILIFSYLSLIEFNKILILNEIRNKFSRFLFLIVMSNGLCIMQVFDYLQTKFIALFFILLFLRREIKRSKLMESYSDHLRFFFIQISILIFAISMIPHYIFLIMIYIMNSVDYKSLLKKIQIKKYALFLIAFFAQNFMFIVYPILFFEFIKGGNFVLGGQCSLYLIYYFLYRELPYNLISIFLLIGLTLILSFEKTLTLEKKFGYFALFSLFLTTYINQTIFVVLLPLIMLLFIDKILDTETNKEPIAFINWIKSNPLLLLSLIVISIIYSMHPIEFYYTFFPFIMKIPMYILILRWTILYLILVFNLYFLNKKQGAIKDNKLGNNLL